MKVPLRALSWAIRFFWIFTLAFVITCAYSATCIKFDFSEPHSSFDGACILVTWPMAIANDGYYAIANLTMRTEIVGNGGEEFASSHTSVGTVHPHQEIEVLHSISFCMNEILVQDQYLFDDSEFTLYSTTSLDYARIIPFEFGTDTMIPWGAPLFNLSTSSPLYSPFNASHVQFTVPISFQNHCPYFNTSGTLRLEVQNSDGLVTVVDRLPVYVPYMENFDGVFSGFVDRSMTGGADSVHISWEAADRTYGPWEIEN
ncbi:MAG: hypothetical protein JSV35_00115 [Candidatus Bathyarchaeota archaeon]|nr:MAG: hypothetical protein JSV35_00115 [Candidatus Bathyarchaeota archaeon]